MSFSTAAAEHQTKFIDIHAKTRFFLVVQKQQNHNLSSVVLKTILKP